MIMANIQVYPFFGDLPKSMIEVMVKSSLTSNVYEYQSLFNLKQFRINIKIDTLNKDPLILDYDDLDTLWLQYQNKNSENIRKMEEFNAKKRIWLAKISRYETKLINILNTRDVRQELIDYILKEAKKVVSNDKLMCFLNTLKSERYIDIDSDSIEEFKGNSQTLLYWVMNFKDYMLQKLLEIRPTRPKTLLQTYPEMIFKRLTPLRKLLIENNENIKYYILRIEVTPVSRNSSSYYFKFPGQYTWNAKVRRCIKLRNDDYSIPACI